VGWREEGREGECGVIADAYLVGGFEVRVEGE
jgi:hypothetical protein